MSSNGEPRYVYQCPVNGGAELCIPVSSKEGAESCIPVSSNGEQLCMSVSSNGEPCYFYQCPGVKR